MQTTPLQMDPSVTVSPLVDDLVPPVLDENQQKRSSLPKIIIGVVISLALVGGGYLLGTNKSAPPLEPKTATAPESVNTSEPTPVATTVPVAESDATAEMDAPIGWKKFVNANGYQIMVPPQAEVGVGGSGVGVTAEEAENASIMTSKFQNLQITDAIGTRPSVLLSVHDAKGKSLEAVATEFYDRNINHPGLTTSPVTPLAKMMVGDREGFGYTMQANGMVESLTEFMSVEGEYRQVFLPLSAGKVLMVSFLNDPEMAQIVSTLSFTGE